MTHIELLEQALEKLQFYVNNSGLLYPNLEDNIKDYLIKNAESTKFSNIIEEVPCKTNPNAPHGFDRSSSHSLGRYVCECENWIPEEDDDGC